MPQPTQAVTNVGLRDTIFFKMASEDFFIRIIRSSLYQSDFDTIGVDMSENSDLAVLFKGFIKNIQKEIKRRNHPNISKQRLISFMDLTTQILNLKTDISTKLLTYENAPTHFTNIDPYILGVLNKICNNCINTDEEFQASIDYITHTIEIYNEMLTIDNVLVDLDKLCISAQHDDFSILNVAQEYRETVLNAYNSLSSLTTISTNDTLSDFLTFKDEASIQTAISEIRTFLAVSYNHYITGYDIFDNHVDGLESSSVHIIAVPSNHAKSIFMLNVARNLIKHNLNTFDEGDCIVFITLEDDIHKLLRRIISVFGGYDTTVVKELFTELSNYFQGENKRDKINTGGSNPGTKILSDVLNKALVNTTGGKVSFIIKHCNENTFSMQDCTRFLDKLKMNGQKVKGLFIDYLDVMKSSASAYDSYKDDYNLHGEILQEMRTASRNYAIPVVTITQNARASENVQQELSNAVIGDSYKKVRYADYIYMIRQRPDIDIISDQLKQDMNGDPATLSGFSSGNSGLGRLVPFEVKITKAKDGDRGAKKIHVFSKQTLGIYDNYDVLNRDSITSGTISSSLFTSLAALGCDTSDSEHGADDFDFSIQHQENVIDSLVL